MKKNLLVLALASLSVLGAVGCGGDVSTPVLDDKENTWHIHGQCQLADGTANDWNGKANELYEASKMTATSISEVKKVSAEVGAALEKKAVKYLYTEDIILGVNDAGWTTNCLMGNDLYSANGSYSFKPVKCSYDAAEEVYAEQQWIPDPRTANVESLTPSTLFVPTWQEAADDNGFSWSSNIVCIGGAGLYTVVVAQYTAVSAAGTPGYGIALIQKEVKESENGTYTKVEKWVASAHTYGIVGSFASSNWGKGADVAMTASADGNSYVGEVTLAVGDQFKVRADGDWTHNWVGAAVEGVCTVADGNMVAAVAGTYVVTISNFGVAGTATVTVALKA